MGKYSDEDVPHKLYVISNNDKGIKKISQVAKFEVLVAKPAPCRLIIKKEGVSTPSGYNILDTNDDIFEDNWEKIKVALKDELMKGTMQIALRKDIHYTFCTMCVWWIMTMEMMSGQQGGRFSIKWE